MKAVQNVAFELALLVLVQRAHAHVLRCLVTGASNPDLSGCSRPTVEKTNTSCQLGTSQIALPDPLDAPWRDLAANPGFSTRAARLGTLHELTKVAPVAIIAETLGYSPTTIERHAIDSAMSYIQYIAAMKESALRQPARN